MVEEFEIKLATIEDIKDVFELSNDELVRANSINPEPIFWENHVNWFNNKIMDKDSVFYIVNNSKNDFMGYVRLDKNESNWVLTIHFKNEYRGKGFGKKTLRTVCNLNKDKYIIALVKEKNLPSLISFEKANFKKVDLIFINDERYHKLKYECNSNK